jgi:uncharacterized membrane protein
MTTISHEPSTRSQRTAWLYMRDLWASLAISVMWLAVLVVSLWGPDIRSFDVSGSSTTLPSGVVLGLFATIGSWAVAKHGFNRTTNSR